VTISLGITTLVFEGWGGNSVVGGHLWQRSQDEVARCSCSGFWSRSPSATKLPQMELMTMEWLAPIDVSRSSSCYIMSYSAIFYTNTHILLQPSVSLVNHSNKLPIELARRLVMLISTTHASFAAAEYRAPGRAIAFQFPFADDGGGA
jgi:hypothetical protein